MYYYKIIITYYYMIVTSLLLRRLLLHYLIIVTLLLLIVTLSISLYYYKFIFSLILHDHYIINTHGKFQTVSQDLLLLSLHYHVLHHYYLQVRSKKVLHTVLKEHQN